MRVRHLNARGDAGSNMIVWFAAIAAALIIAVWFIRNNPYTMIKSVNDMDEDLLQISKSIGNACNADEYLSGYNPLTEHGQVIFQDRQICINQTDGKRTVTRCIDAPCSAATRSSFDLQGITLIMIGKKSIQKTESYVNEVGAIDIVRTNEIWNISVK